jgi:hypothetical protein
VSELGVERLIAVGVWILFTRIGGIEALGKAINDGPQSLLGEVIIFVCPDHSVSLRVTPWDFPELSSESQQQPTLKLPPGFDSGPRLAGDYVELQMLYAV